MKSVAIIGAGITGLTAAFTLKRAGIPVTLYESSHRVGGAIQSMRYDGYLAEYGPNTILETSPRITQLVRDLGLESRRMESDSKSEQRYLVRSGRVISLPESPWGFLTTDLFSWRAKLAVLREPFLPSKKNDTEESVAEFVMRRLGKEFLNYAVDAMIGGIYAGDPEKLSVAQAFPKLAALETEYGSLLRGNILGARDRRQRGEVAKDRAPKFSFDEGLQVLPDAMAQQLAESIQLDTSVMSLTQVGEEWILGGRKREKDFSTYHRAIIYAGTACRLSELNIVTDSQKLDFSPFNEIYYPPIVSVVLGFRREDVDHPCEGFGALIPKIEGFSILGTIFSSSLFSNRAPVRHLTLTSYIGGDRYPELTLLPEAEIYKLVQHDLEKLFGVKGQPTFQHCTIYPKAIPQYNLGYARYLELMNEIEAKVSGFYFAGNYRNGISLSDSILSGFQTAERVVKTLCHSQATSS